MSMNRKTIDDLAQHYDNHDTVREMEGGDVHTPVTDPMVVVSVRLPKDTMDEVRAMASQQSTRPTALIRQWIEEQLAAGQEPQGVVPVKALIGFVNRNAVTEPPRPT